VGIKREPEQCPAYRKDGSKCVAFKAAGRDTCAAHDISTLHKRRPQLQAHTIERAETERARLLRRIEQDRIRLAAVDDRLTRYGIKVKRAPRE
jgi:hypothetical protein